MASEQTIVFPLEAVRSAWENREFTQAEMAEKVGRSPSNVCRIVTGQRDPGEEVSKKLYQALLDIRAEKRAAEAAKKGAE